MKLSASSTTKEPPTAAMTLDGLRLRLAAQIAPRRWRSPLLRLAEAAQGGQPLDASVRSVALPPELSSLFAEALRLREPTAFVLDTLRARVLLKNSWGQFSSVVAYPLILLVLTVFCGLFLSVQLSQWIDWEWEFGSTNSIQLLAKDQQNAVLGAAYVVGWTAVVFMLLKTVAPGWAWTAVVGSLMLVGRPTRWLRLQALLLRFEAMAKQGVPDGRLADAVARSFANSDQALVASQVARRVRAGMPIGHALASTGLSDGLVRPALVLLDYGGNDRGVGGDRGNGGDGAFARNCESCAELLGQLIQQRCQLLTVMLPVLLIILVGSVIWSILGTHIHIVIAILSMFW